MALVQDTTVRFMDPPNGQNFTFKLSKPLNQITLEDIKSQDSYVGFTNFGINTIGEGVLSQGSPVNNPNHCFMWATDNSSLYSDINEVGHWCTPASYPTGVYMRNILIYAPIEVHNNGSFIKTDANARIVIDITPDANTTLQKLAIGSDHHLVCWYNDDTRSENRVDNYNYIYPAVLFEINGTTYIYVQELYPWWVRYYIDDLLNQGFVTGDAKVNFANESFHRLACGWTVGATAVGEPFFTKFTGEGNSRQIANYNINGHLSTFAVSAYGTNYHWRVFESLTDNEDQTITKQYYANTGFRFKIGGVWYKPIVEGGVVTGYTDDMTVQSEWDTWTTAKGHNVPVGPPAPPTPEEDPRDASIYGTYSGGAGVFARCWYCNQTALESLWIWAGGSDDPDDPQPPEGFSPINSIIGLQMFPVNIPIPQGTAKSAIVFFNAVAEGDRTVNTHVSDDVYLGTGQTFEIDLGSVEVKKHHADDWAYLDYDETVELYIPFCGVYNIDTQSVIGRTITAKLYVDPIAGTCTFIATCDNVDVAMGSGSMAVSLPVTANQYSMTLAAINNNRAAARNAAISSVVTAGAQAAASYASGYSNGYKGAERQMLSVAGSYDDLADVYGAGNPVRIARGAGIRSGLASAVTSISNGFTSASIGGLINSALNTRRANKMLASANNTAVSGSFGGSQDTWRLPMQAYIKTIRYLTKIPDNHVDVIGKIFLQKTKLSECSGYTTVANPDLSSLTAFLTTAELTELYGILLNGIYAGGGGAE